MEKILGQCVDLRDQLAFYSAGGEGPVGAEALMARAGRQWLSGKAYKRRINENI